MLPRLKQLDESNGNTAIGIPGDDTTDSAEEARTGQVHAAAKEDIVRHWLQGSLENVSPSGWLHHTPYPALHSDYTLRTFTKAQSAHQLAHHCQACHACLQIS